MTRRLAIAFFYDEQGVVDEYMLHLIRSMQSFVEETVFVANGNLTRDSERAVAAVVDQVIIRRNEGMDAWAYKAGIEAIGYGKLAEFDEVLFYNHTFFGPIYPFSELFEEMDKRTCDFWGISAHAEVKPNPINGSAVLPWHLNSYFVAVRQSLLRSKNFRRYWDELPRIETYSDAVLKHEVRFSTHFTALGFKAEAYVDPKDYGTPQPGFYEIDKAIENRIPILKRRLFHHNPVDIDDKAINLPRALRLIEQTSDYDLNLIWPNVLRDAQLRELGTAAALTRVLPDVSTRMPQQGRDKQRIAVCAHVYYDDMIEELLGYCGTISDGFDFLATTDTENKKAAIEKVAQSWPSVGKVVVRVVEQNRGRDMSSLFISFRDIFVTDDYDLACRIHTKRTPQVDRARGDFFKIHMLENILHSPGYTDNVIALFQDQPALGVAIPPLIHIGFGTLGHSWFNNRENARGWAAKIGLRVRFDDDTPVAANGTMFWFRPKALRKLFAYDFKWEDFNAEPNHVDGGLAHVLERLICYAAQDAGFLTMQILSPAQAEQNYALLEYKLQKLSAQLPLQHYTNHLDMLRHWKALGYPSSITSMSLKQSSLQLARAIKRSLRFRLRRILRR